MAPRLENPDGWRQGQWVRLLYDDWHLTSPDRVRGDPALGRDGARIVDRPAAGGPRPVRRRLGRARPGVPLHVQVVGPEPRQRATAAGGLGRAQATSLTSSAGGGMSPVDPISARMRATYPRVSLIGGTQRQPLTAPGPAL